MPPPDQRHVSVLVSYCCVTSDSLKLAAKHDTHDFRVSVGEKCGSCLAGWVPKALATVILKGVEL